MIEIRPFSEGDASQVRELFIKVNRLLSPPQMRSAFAGYVDRSLREEIDRITEYYGSKGGGFWVAADGGRVVGMFVRA